MLVYLFHICMYSLIVAQSPLSMGLSRPKNTQARSQQSFCGQEREMKVSKLPSPLTVAGVGQDDKRVCFLTSCSAFFFLIKNDLVIGIQYQQSKQSQVAEGELCTGSSAK